MAPHARPLSVLHLTSGSDAGGVSRYIHDLSCAMHAQGHRVTVAGERSHWHDLFLRSPIAWHELPLKGGPLKLFQCLKPLRSLLQETRADLIHVHYRKPALLARRVAPAFKVPILYTLHLTDISMTGPMRLLTDLGDHTHAPSQAARDWLIHEARIDPERITLIPHGIDPHRFPQATEHSRAKARTALNLPPNATVAAFVGRFDQPKNVLWMLDVLTASQARTTPGTTSNQPPLHLLFMGQGPDEQALRNQIACHRWQRHAQILPYDNPLTVYHAADALLLPSSREGFSLVCAEALSAGCPVLRTATAGHHEQIIQGVTGSVTAIDRTAFARAAALFLADRPALARMGAAAAEHVRRHLTFQQQLDDTLKLYHSLLSARQAHSPRA
jgi:glycosyltransferase involved in cell wall biosynthesis